MEPYKIKKMKGLVHFIVHIPQKYNETFKTKSGMELYGDRRWSPKEMANNVLDVIETPFIYDGPIQNGQKIFIDPTVLFQQIYSKGGEQENIHLVDREKNHYKVDQRLVIAYEKDGKWIGHNDNLLVELGFEEPVKSDNLHIPEMANGKIDRKKGKIIVGNRSMSGLDVKVGDTVIAKPLMGIDLWFNGKLLTWFRNQDLLALVLNEAV